MSKIFLTGAAGFIGSAVGAALAVDGHTVVGVDNFNDYYDPQLKRDRVEALLKPVGVDVIEADITDEAVMRGLFETHRPDKICHLAARAGVRASLEDPLLYEKVNVRGSMVLLELAREFEVESFVCASSSSVYGKNKKVPFSESDPVDEPISPYAATKKAVELISYTYHHLYQLPVANLRFFTVYGPWGRPDMAIFKFSNWMREGKPIDVYNHGDMKRDFTYIDDIVRGVVAALEKTTEGYHIYNLGNNSPEQLGKLIELLEKELGVVAEKNMMDMQPGDVPITYADVSLAGKELGYAPTTSLEEGVAKFADWYTQYYGVKA